MVGRWVGLCTLLSVCVAVFVQGFSVGITTQLDSSRYVQSALNLLDHGVLSGRPYIPGQVPTPGLPEGGVWTIAELAVAAAVDPHTRQAFECILTVKDRSVCATDLWPVQALYSLEISIFLICLFAVGRLVTGDWIRPSIAVVGAFFFKEIKGYSHDILSEPGTMMMTGLFLLTWLRAVMEPARASRWLLAGVMLGGLALVKPSWTALVPGLAVCALVLMLFLRRDRLLWGRGWLLLVAGWGVVMLPLLVRNIVVLDFVGFSDPLYLVASMSHRFAFNAMTWAELGAGFLFYLPDFGDSLSMSLFGPGLAAHLGWGPDSFYNHGRGPLNLLALSKGTLADARAFLWQEHFFNTPVKSSLVTVLLMWRGLFVSNLVGLVAVVMAVPFLAGARWLGTQDRGLRLRLAAVLLPLLLMVGAHALISVSISRYNIGLIIPYALILAYLLHRIGEGAVMLLSGGRRAGRS